MTDAWYAIGHAVEQLWGHTVTCGAANEICAQARRFGKEAEVHRIIGTIAGPGVQLIKGSYRGMFENTATVENVDLDGTVHLVRERDGQVSRFTWALSSMVFWYLSGQLAHSKAVP